MIPEVFGGLKVRVVIAFDAKSKIEPPFKSIELDIEIPSVSNSEVLLATVYLNNAVLLSV